MLWYCGLRIDGRLAIVCCCAGAACRTASPAHAPIVQPGAPGEAARAITREQATDLSRVQYVGADIKFMQAMIGHHAQALEMTALVPARAGREEMRGLALRIELSQVDEITMMQRWLRERGQNVPNGREHHMGGGLMPGMLTEDEMRQLAAVKDAEFDRLFLEGMIKHHEGALTMVRELFATPGAAQASEVFAFASDVEADQSAEIERMGGMLDAILREKK